MSKNEKRLKSSCPFCEGELEVTRLHCTDCDTQIDSSLTIPAFFRLPNELQLFVLVFLRCRGNIREVEKELGISYPTVCKRLDLVNELLGSSPPPLSAKRKAASDGADKTSTVRELILKQVERGELSAVDAALQLQKIKN